VGAACQRAQQYLGQPLCSGHRLGYADIDRNGKYPDAYYPKIAIDANGNAVAVWSQYDGTRLNIWANRYVAGTGWGTAALIETDNAGAAVLPRVAMDANGNAIAVWVQFDGTRNNVWANRYVYVSNTWARPH